MATFNNTLMIAQPSIISFGGAEVGYTESGFTVTYSPEVINFTGEEEGVHLLAGFWGGVGIEAVSVLLQAYGDATVKTLAFSALATATGGTIPNSTNLPIGKRIDTATYAKALVIAPRYGSGQTITIAKCFAFVRGDVQYRLRDLTKFPIMFVPYVRGTDTFAMTET